MTRVDFYILKDLDQSAAFRFACRLSLKGFQSGQPVHVHTENKDDAASIDELMWDYPQHRFVPHTTQLDNGPSTPVYIGWETPSHQDGHQGGLLINVSSAVPNFFGRFDRLAEIVVEETKVQGRERYSHYRDRGYAVQSHRVLPIPRRSMAYWDSHDRRL